MKQKVLSPIVAMSLMTGAAFADESAKEAQCTAMSSIVTKLVDLRQDRKNERRAVRTLTNDETIEEGWKPAVPLLAGWVYTLPEADLKLEPGKAYFDACMSQ